MLILFVSAGLIVALGLEVVIFRVEDAAPTTTTTQIINVSRDNTGARVDLAARFTSADRSVSVVAFPVSKTNLRTTVDVFDDPELPYSGSSSALVQGAMSEVAADAAITAPNVQVFSVGVSGLGVTLRDVVNAPTTALVLLTGTLPSVIFSSRVDLIKPWVDAGGVVVWGGDTIGYYSVAPGELLNPTGPNNPRASGATSLLGDAIIHFPTVHGRSGTTPSQIARALDLRYSATSSGVVTALMRRPGDMDLGVDGDGLTSIAYRSEGLGGFVLFGGPITDPSIVGADIARILFSNVLSSTGGIAAITIESRGVGTATSTLSLTLPSSSDLLMILASTATRYPQFIEVADVSLGAVK